MGFRNFVNFLVSFSIILLFVVVASPLWRDFFVYGCTALLAIPLADWLSESTRKYFLHKAISSKNKAVFITGCDSGFGHAAAKRMHKQGFKMFAGCLNPKGPGAEELKETCGSNLFVVPLDVTSDESVKEAFEFVKSNLKECDLWAVLNNAGIVSVAEIEWINLQNFKQMAEVNSFGVVRVVKAFLPLLKKSRGRIIVNSSLAGRVACQFLAPYCMSKSAATSFARCLSLEMAKWDIDVITIEPSFFKTPLTEKKTVRMGIEEMWKVAAVEEKQDFKEDYINKLKELSISTIERFSSADINTVIDCFNDAITAEDPLTAYFPCSFGLKALVKLTGLFPIAVRNFIMKCHSRPLKFTIKKSNK